MKIIIDNKKQLNHFYFMLPFYKSILFKFTRFELDKDLYHVRGIIDALNIKRRKQRIEYIYDYVCCYIDDFYKDRNVCEFKNNKCLTQRSKENLFDGCCRLCSYKSCNGCTTKNLTCKFFYCASVKEKHKIIEMKDIPILRCFSIRQRLLIQSDYFSHRDDVIKDLYYGSLFIGCFRIVYRLIRSFFQKRTKHTENKTIG